MPSGSRLLLSTQGVPGVDVWWPQVAFVHVGGAWGGCLVAAGCFCPRRGCLAWMFGGARLLLSTQGCIFVDALRVAGFLLILRHIWHFMFEFIKNKLRRKALNGVKVAKSGVSVFPGAALLHSMGVVCTIRREEDVAAFEQMVEFISGEGIRFSVVVVEAGKCFRSSESRSSFGGYCSEKGFVFVESGSVNWLGVPDKELLKEFWSMDMDLLVSIDDTRNFTADYIVCGAKSRFLAGMYPSGRVVYDLLLSPGKKEMSCKEFMVSLLGYLKVMQDGE